VTGSQIKHMPININLCLLSKQTPFRHLIEHLKGHVMARTEETTEGESREETITKQAVGGQEENQPTNTHGATGDKRKINPQTCMTGGGADQRTRDRTPVTKHMNGQGGSGYT